MLSYTRDWNPYEQAKANLQNDELYAELGGNETWTQYAKSGSLDTLIGTINTAKDKMSIADIRNLPNWSLYDSEHKMQQLAVSLFSDNEKKKDRTKIVYDAEGNPQRTVTAMTDKEYYQKILNEYASARQEKLIKEQEQAAKDNMDTFEKVVNTAGSILANTGLNLLNTVESMGTFIGQTGYGIYNSIKALISDEARDARWENFDKAWREAGEIKFQPTKDLRDSLAEWDRLNSYYLDINGNPTALGSLTNLISDAAGQALTLMAFNFGGAAISAIGKGTSAAKVFTAVGSGVQKAGQILYWSGMAANNYHELCSDPSLASVPTLYLATNAALRAGAEYAITKTMAKAFGASTLKKLTLNYTPKSGMVSGTKRFITDILKEGAEEALQEYSGQFINTATYVIHSKFGAKASPLSKYAGYNFSDMFNAFIAGALVSGLSSAVEVLTTKRIETDEVLRDKQGNIVTDKDGNVKFKKFSKWKSWNIIANTQSLMGEIQNFLNDTSNSLENREVMLGQAVQSFQLLASFYGQIGQEASERVISFMQDFTAAYTTETDTAVAKAQLNAAMIKMQTEIVNLASEYSDSRVANFEKAKDELAKKMADAHITDIKETHIKAEFDTMKTETTTRSPAEKAAAASIDAILNMPDTKSVSISKNGTNSVNVDGHRVVPENMVNSSADIVTDLRKNDACNTFIDVIVKAPELKLALNEITKVYKQYANKDNVSTEEVVAALLNDSELYKYCLYNTTPIAKQMLLHLDKIVNVAFEDSITEDLYKQQINNTKKEWKKAIVEYLIIQDNVDESLVTMLTPAQKSYVTSHRYTKDIGGRIILGIATTDDMNAVLNRINASNMELIKKATLIGNLKSKDKLTREGAVNTINEMFLGEYRNVYDGKHYPKLDTVGGWKLSQVLNNNDVTLENWLTKPVPNEQGTADQILQQRKDYYKNQFEALTGNNYNLNIADNGTYTIRENFKAQRIDYNEIIAGVRGQGPLLYAESIVANKIIDNKKYYQDYISKDISKVGKEYYSLTDYIRDSSLLSKDTYDAIKEVYGVVTEGTTFLYLRQSILSDTGHVSIVKLNNGDYALADIQPFFSLMNDSETTIKDTDTLADIIKGKYLKGRLKDTQLKFTDLKDTNGRYDADNNTIYINNALFNNQALMRYTILHEFEHAIQHTNNISSGTNFNIKTLSQFSVKAQQEIIDEIRNRYGFLDKVQKGSIIEKDIVSTFIYMCVTGEWDARGWIGIEAIPQRVPMFMRTVGNKKVLDTPWGSYDVFSGNEYSYPVQEKHTNGDIISDLVPVEDYQEYIYRNDLYGNDNKVSRDERIEIDGKFLSKEVRMNDAIDKWTRAQVGTGALDSNKIRSEQITARTAAYNYIVENPEVRDIMLKKLWIDIAPTVPYENFLTMQIPFCRIQTNPNYWDSEFVSAMIGDTVSFNKAMQNYLKLSEHFADSIVYLTTGTITPNELIGYLGTEEYEALIPTNVAANSKTTQIHTDLYGNVIVYPENFKYDNMAIDNYKFATLDDISNFVDTAIFKYSSYVKFTNNRPNRDYYYEYLLPSGETKYSIDEAKPADLYNIAKSYVNANNLQNEIAKQLRDNFIVIHHLANDIEVNIGPMITETNLKYLVSTLVDYAKLGKDISVKYNGFNISEDLRYSSMSESELLGMLDDIKEYSAYDQDGNAHVMYEESKKIELTEEEKAQIENMTEEEKAAFLAERERFLKTLKKEVYVRKHKKGVITDATTQPKTPRYVSNKEAVQTNLRYFIKKYKPIQIDPETRAFIEAADASQLNKSLWKMIGGSQKGTLTYQKLMNWVRTIDPKKVNDYTWKLLNKTFFHNSAIKSFKQLAELSTNKAGSYYAMWCALRDIGKADMASKRMSQEKFDALIAETTDPKNADKPLTKAYVKHLETYDKHMSEVTAAKEGAARLAWANDFDGSIESGGRAAGLAYWLILSGYNAAGERKTTSMQQQIGGGKGDDTSHELGDLIADPTATNAFNRITGDVPKEQMNAYLKLYMVRKLYQDYDAGKYTDEQLEQQKQNILDAVNKLSADDLAERYFAIKVADLSGDTTLIKAAAEAQAKNEQLIPERPKKTVSDNINRIIRNIKSKLSPKAFAKMEAEYPDLFTDGKANKEKWQGKDIKEYLAAEEKLKEIQYKATHGYYNNALAKEIFTKVEREKAKNEKLKGEKQRLQEKVKSLKGEVATLKEHATMKFADSTFDIHSDKPMPEKLDTLLKTSFEKVNESSVKYVTTDETNTQISMQHFFEANAETLASISQEEATEIVDFYASSIAIEGDITRNDIRKYDAIKIFVLANFRDLELNGIYSFDEDTNVKLDSLLNTQVSNAATIMAAWSKAARLANPARSISSALRNYYGIEVPEDEITNLVKALRKPVEPDKASTKTSEELKKEKIAAIQEAIAVINNDIRYQSLSHKKSDVIWDTLWKFERWAMLSMPGTAIRNIASNIVVDKFGKLAEKITQNMFNKREAKVQKAMDEFDAWRKANPDATSIPDEIAVKLPGPMQRKYKQYKIAGTKVDTKTEAFVDGMFNEVLYTQTDAKGKVTTFSFYDAMSDGLTKYYGDRVSGDTKGEMTAANTIAKSIIIKMFGNQMFDTTRVQNEKAKTVMEVMNNVANFTFKTLSDDGWIRNETKRLFSKMLVEDKIDISKGYTNEVLDTLAEAYTLAAYKYMHRRNFITSMDNAIRKRVGAAGYFMYKQLFPFAGAAVNWFAEGLNFTPIGLAKGILNYAKLEGTIEKMDNKRAEAMDKGQTDVSPRFAAYLAKQQIGKGIIGSIGMLIGILLAGAGLAGLDKDDDKYKLRIGTNFYVDISNVFGTQGILAGIAIRSMFGDDSASFWDVTKGTLNSMFDDFVFNDLYNNIKYSSTPIDFFINQTESALFSFIPNFLKAFNRNLYSFAPQYSNNKLVAFLQKAGVYAIPGMAYALPKKMDIYTGEIESKYNLPYLVKAINSLSPVSIAPYKVSANEKEAILQGVNKSYLTGKYTDIGELSTKDKVKLNKKYGELNDKTLNELFASKTKYKVKKEDGTYVELVYNKMTPAQKKSVIQRIMSNNASIAKIYVYTENGGKYYTTDNEYKELKKLGIKNVYIQQGKKKGFN